MQQPYIFKRQLVGLTIAMFTLVYIMQIRNLQLFFVGCSYLFLLLSMTFLPIIKKFIGYPDFLQPFLFMIPYILPFLFFRIDSIKILYNLPISFLVGMIFIATLLFFERKELSAIIKSTNAKLYISKPEFLSKFSVGLLTIIIEELYFRLFALSIIEKSVGISGVFIVSILFCGAHYLNRWANINYSFKNYILLFFLSVLLSFIYIYFDNQILACILLHFVYNITFFYLLVIRLYKSRNDKNQSVFFNDYD